MFKTKDSIHLISSEKTFRALSMKQQNSVPTPKITELECEILFDKGIHTSDNAIAFVSKIPGINLFFAVKLDDNGFHDKNLLDLKVFFLLLLIHRSRIWILLLKARLHFMIFHQIVSSRYIRS